MTVRWRLLADDATGALDSAAAFAGRHAVPVRLLPPGKDEADVAAASTATRDVEAACLPERLRPWLAWLAGGLAFKKVDSLVRGNTFAEVAWLFEAGGYERMVFAPAFPAWGRCTRKGLHHQPNAPAIDLRAALAAVGLDVHVGPMNQARDGSVVIPDAADDRDLATIAACTRGLEAKRWLWCGSAGLAGAVGREWAMTGRPVELSAHAPFVLVTSSRHAVVRTQLAALIEAGMPVRSVATADGDHAFVVIDLAPAAELDPATAAPALAEAAHQLVDRLTPGLLIVIGGDTLQALCEASCARGLSAEAAPRLGWGNARLVGGRWSGLRCLSRSGAFGDRNDLLTLLRSLTREERQS